MASIPKGEQFTLRAAAIESMHPIVSTTRAMPGVIPASVKTGT